MENKEVAKIEKNDTGLISVNDINIDADRLEIIKSELAQLKDDDIVKIGQNTQKSISKTADNFIERVKSFDSNDMTMELMTLKKRLDKLDISDLNREKSLMGRIGDTISHNIPFLNKSVKKVKKIFKSYEDVNTQISNVVVHLKKGHVEALKDNTILSDMKSNIEDNIEEITEDILKISIKYNSIKEELDKIDSSTEEGKQEILEKTYLLKNIERRGHDLSTSRGILYMFLSNIHLVKEGNNVMIDKINSAITNTIPVWKNAIAINIAIFKQNVNTKKIKAFSDHTNQLIKNQSESIKDNMINIFTENNRSVLDIETISNSIKNITETIEEVMKIEAEGKENRKNMNFEINQMVLDMNKTYENLQIDDIKKE